MTRSAPLVPRVWDADRLTLLSAAATLAPLTAWGIEGGSARLIALALALGLAALWHLVFARLRGRPTGWDGIVTAMVFVILVPDTVPLWQQGLALSFGLVMGDLVFGGRGRGFLTPSAVGLAFLLFSFPAVNDAPPGMATTLAALVSAAVLLGVGVLSWRVVAGFSAALIGASLALQGGWPAWPSATLILGLAFIIGDPVAAACTNAGRWAYGLLAGGLMVLLGDAGGSTLSAMVFAALLAAIFAPLIDQAVIWTNVRRRARRQRHG